MTGHTAFYAIDGYWGEREQADVNTAFFLYYHHDTYVVLHILCLPNLTYIAIQFLSLSFHILYAHLIYSTAISFPTMAPFHCL